jgi:long-chain acyl-CoA synthetase
VQTLSSTLRVAVGRWPDHPAVIEDGRTLAYQSISDMIRQVVGLLAAKGVGAGSRVAIVLPNGAWFVTSFFAIAHLGAVVVPLNPSLQESEMASIMTDAGVSLVLTLGNLGDQCLGALRSAVGAGAEAVVALDESDLDTAVNGTSSWPGEPARPSDPVLFLYSSGSTGRPKRIARTHFNLLYEVECLKETLSISPSDRILGVAPFSHTNGLLRSMIVSVLSGATLVPIAQFERRAVARAIEQHRITGFIGVPFMFAMLAEARWPQPVDFSSLRYCISSSAPLRRETSLQFYRRYSLYVRQLYGTTETGSIAVNLGPHPEKTIDSVGMPYPGITVEIFSPHRKVLPPGEIGDIAIRSPAATQEYVGLPEETAASFVDGYFFPGDMGYKDAEGNIYLSGRKSLFINRGGHKVNPYEIENLIESHPKVREVAVVGVDTPYGDQKIKAVVVPVEPHEESEIIDFCRGKVADFKIPSIVEFRIELPKSSTGKPLRKLL